MNATIISKLNVTDDVLDVLAKELPKFIAEALDVPGGNLARLKPEQVSLDFFQASKFDVGSDIKIMIFARNNDPRTSTENDRANLILERVTTLLNKSKEKYSVDIRLYLMEIGVANTN
jgi:hypothetical protein